MLEAGRFCEAALWSIAARNVRYLDHVPLSRTTLAFHKLWHLRRDTLRRWVCSYGREGAVRKMLKLHGMVLPPRDSAREGYRDPRLAWLRHVPA